MVSKIKTNFKIKLIRLIVLILIIVLILTFQNHLIDFMTGLFSLD
jgi:hypothetical protein